MQRTQRMHVVINQDINMIEAKVIEDSVSIYGDRITTMQIKFQRFILPEFLTHRVFSRNFSSSRAIPTAKLIEQVRNDPAMPVHWGKNQAGMQARVELSDDERLEAIGRWKYAASVAAANAQCLSDLGAHKQIVNRVLEPYMWVTGIVTSTEWENWNSLRDHEDAQPEIRELAKTMKVAYDASEPVELVIGDWHLPYVTPAEKRNSLLSLTSLIRVSAARCCRVSYLKHDGATPSIEDDMKLFERLAGAEPKHYSPLEHQATPDGFLGQSYVRPELHGNFRGWIQFRKLDEHGYV